MRANLTMPSPRQLVCADVTDGMDIISELIAHLEALQPAITRRVQLQAQLDSINADLLATLQQVLKKAPDAAPDAAADDAVCTDFILENVFVSRINMSQEAQALNKRLAHAIKQCADTSVHGSTSEANFLRSLLVLDRRLTLHAAKANIDSKEVENLQKAFCSTNVIALGQVPEPVLRAHATASAAIQEAADSRAGLLQEPLVSATPPQTPSTLPALAPPARSSRTPSASSSDTMSDVTVPNDSAPKNARREPDYAEDPTLTEVGMADNAIPLNELNVIASRTDKVFNIRAEDIKEICDKTGLTEESIKLGVLARSCRVKFSTNKSVALSLQHDTARWSDPSGSQPAINGILPFVLVPGPNKLVLRPAWYTEFTAKVDTMLETELPSYSPVPAQPADAMDENSESDSEPEVKTVLQSLCSSVAHCL
eukprot:TRINITY_DN7492_c0_g1_i5.p1 TRINITY_DN7492_c0_g1~~TRINITY_DN7492_c0_g1_i5.p1  ORF type:complete len:426 (-),score=76.97 TRINITY_DN7492_c0_g1_i5:233-1510(-)